MCTYSGETDYKNEECGRPRGVHKAPDGGDVAVRPTPHAGHRPLLRAANSLGNSPYLW